MAKKPAEIMRSTIASFAELRRLNAQEEARKLSILRQRANRAIPVVVAKSLSCGDTARTILVEALRAGSVAVSVTVVRPGYGIQGK